MHYLYPPIYKYILLIIVIFLFFKDQKDENTNKIIENSLFIVSFIAIIDYIIINEHPVLYKTGYKKPKVKKIYIEVPVKDESKPEIDSPLYDN